MERLQQRVSPASAALLEPGAPPRTFDVPSQLWPTLATSQPSGPASLPEQPMTAPEHGHGEDEDESMAPDPGSLGPEWVFECWTGQTWRWQAYDAPIQALLRASYNAGGDVHGVNIGHAEVNISTVPGDFWQDNPYTEAPRRQVRLATRRA